MKIKAKFRIGDRVQIDIPPADPKTSKIATIIGCFAMPDAEDTFCYAVKELGSAELAPKVDVEKSLWKESQLTPMREGIDFVDDSAALQSFFDDSKEEFLKKYAETYSECDWEATARVLQKISTTDVSEIERRIIDSQPLSQDDIKEAIKTVRATRKKTVVNGIYVFKPDEAEPHKVSFYTELRIGDVEILTDYWAFVYAKWGWCRLSYKTPDEICTADERLHMYREFYANEIFKAIGSEAIGGEDGIEYDFETKDGDLYFTIRAQF